MEATVTRLEYVVTPFDGKNWLELFRYDSLKTAKTCKEEVEVAEDTSVVIRVYEIVEENKPANLLSGTVKILAKTLIETIK